MRFSDLKVGTKLALGFGAMVAITALLGTISWRNGTLTEAAQIEVERAHTMHRAISDMSIAMVRQEAALRALLLSGDKSFVEPYRLSQNDYADALDHARAAASSEEIGKALQSFDELATKWRTEFGDKEVQMASSFETLRQARGLETSGASKPLTDGLKAKTQELNELVRHHIEAGAAQLSRTFVMAQWATVIGLLASVGLAAGAALALTRAIALPVRGMTGAMTRLPAAMSASTSRPAGGATRLARWPGRSRSSRTT